jgi:hypothetical protein
MDLPAKADGWAGERANRAEPCPQGTSFDIACRTSVRLSLRSPFHNSSKHLSMSKSIDYKSLEWMPKSVWGPIKWKELHCRALVPLPMNGESYWFAAYLEGLPCAKCRLHFEAFVHDHPPDFRSRNAFFEWTVLAHNHVNEANDKPVMTLAEARWAHREIFKDLASQVHATVLKGSMLATRI